MNMTNEKFYEVFNSRVFGDTIETIVTIKRMEQLGLVKLSETQKLKLNEYFDRAMVR